MTTTFRASTRIVGGLGSALTLDGELTRLGATHVAVVADEGIIRLGLVADLIRRAGIAERVVATIAADVDPSPASVSDAARQAVDAGADTVIGIGGGSGLCAAKAVALLLRNDVPIIDLEGVDRAARPPAPTIAIPTTAGSGSEVSNALVLHEPGLVREIVIRGDGYEPHVAILDATLLRGLPRDPLVYAGLDALSHALESLWSKRRSVFTDSCALRAADVILDRLPDAADGAVDGRNRSGANDGLLQELLEASSLANLACGNSGLALVHALSSSPAVPLAHGLQNGILLPVVAELNRSALTPEAASLVDRIGPLYERLGFVARFEDGVADREAMLAASVGHAFRMNNAYGATDDELRDALAAVGAEVRVLEHEAAD